MTESDFTGLDWRKRQIEENERERRRNKWTDQEIQDAYEGGWRLPDFDDSEESEED